MQTVLCEDQSFKRLRPLAWSVPTYEIRCGMFNLRERVELASGAGGLLRARKELAPLNAAPAWNSGVEASAPRSLWLNGRLAPSGALVQALLSEAEGGDWLLQDEHGLLAAAVSGVAAKELEASWRQWQPGAWAGDVWVLPAAVQKLGPPELPANLTPHELGWIWDLVPATAAALAADLALLGPAGSLGRYPYGLHTAGEAPWNRAGGLRRLDPDAVPPGVHVTGQGGVHLGSSGVILAPGTHLDTREGPVILDGGVEVMAHAYLAGPLYLGRGCLVKPGARIFGESSFGVGNRLAGEIGESTFGDFANKQHDGFIGHAVLGSWVNLGAMTTCSDLKNNYGPVRVDLGEGELETGRRFVGLLLGDHVKTAIGSLFNTGTSVGYASNIFGGGMPPKLVRPFSWGGQAGAPLYDGQRSAATAATVLQRRNCLWTEAHAALMNHLSSLAAEGG